MGGTLISYPTVGEFIKICQTDEVSAISGFSKPTLKRMTEEIMEKRIKSRRTMNEYLVYDVVSEFLKCKGIQVNEKQFHGFVEKTYAEYAKNIKLYPHALEALKELKKRNLKVGLVSNTCFPADFHRKDLKRFGLLKFFDFTLFSSEFGYRKPHRAIYQQALLFLKMQNNPEQVIFFGDLLGNDVQGPIGAGMTGVLVDHGNTNEYSEYGKITSLNEVIRMIDGF